MKYFYLTLFLVGVVVLAITAKLYVDEKNSHSVNDEVVQIDNVTSFDECVTAGNAVMESYPRQCRSASGNLFVENIGNELEKSNLITINNPRPNQNISSPLTINGEARGYWFFEASFPVVLTNWDGLIIAEGFVTADGEWMTEDFVPYTAILEFTSPYNLGDPEFMKNGSLILKKDNPSGLPENDDALEIPVKFN